MTLNITWLFGYSQSSAAVEGTSCTLSPNPIASSILSPETLPWGQRARERWDHILTFLSDSLNPGQCLSKCASEPDEGVTREPTVNAYCLFQPGPAESEAGDVGQPPIPSMAHLPYILRTQESRPLGLLMPVDHLYTRFLMDLKVDIQTPHGPLCFFLVSFLLHVVSALCKCLAFLIC